MSDQLKTAVAKGRAIVALPAEESSQIMALLRKKATPAGLTPEDEARLKALATMLHVASGGAFSLTLDGDIVA
jgi:hypothetical protein